MVSILLAALSFSPVLVPFMKTLTEKRFICSDDYLIAEPEDENMSTAERAWWILHSSKDPQKSKHDGFFALYPVLTMDCE